jgi:hypothetical protein
MQDRKEQPLDLLCEFAVSTDGNWNNPIYEGQMDIRVQRVIAQILFSSLFCLGLKQKRGRGYDGPQHVV